MSTENDIVEHLRKVSIAIEAGTTPDRMEIDIEPRGAAFVFGIGTEGLTPFEAKLAGMRVGEELVFSLNPFQASAALGHLCQYMPKIPEVPGPVFLRIRVEGVQTAENREIVRAMAEMTACGEGCCGSH